MALCLFGCVRDRYPAVYLKKAGLFYWTRDAWFCMSVSQTQNLVKFPACSWTGQWSRKPWGSSTRYKLQLWVDDCVLEAPEQDLTSLGASRHIKTACEWRQASCGWDCEPLESGSWDAGPILRCSCHVLFATTSVSLTAPYFENSKRLLNTGPYWPHCFGIFGVIYDICDLCLSRKSWSRSVRRSTGLPALLILCPLCALVGAGTASNLGLLGFANVAKGGMAEPGEWSMMNSRIVIYDLWSSMPRLFHHQSCPSTLRRYSKADFLNLSGSWITYLYPIFVWYTVVVTQVGCKVDIASPQVRIWLNYVEAGAKASQVVRPWHMSAVSPATTHIQHLFLRPLFSEPSGLLWSDVTNGFGPLAKDSLVDCVIYNLFHGLLPEESLQVSKAVGFCFFCFPFQWPRQDHDGAARKLCIAFQPAWQSHEGAPSHRYISFNRCKELCQIEHQQVSPCVSPCVLICFDARNPGVCSAKLFGGTDLWSQQPFLG